MASATTKKSAPRGTKSLTRAFFAAAAEIPEPERPGVIKAALAQMIREDMAAVKATGAAAKAKAEEKAATKATAATKRAAPASPEGRAVRAKRKAKPAAKRKPTARRAPSQQQAPGTGAPAES